MAAPIIPALLALLRAGGARAAAGTAGAGSQGFIASLLRGGGARAAAGTAAGEGAEATTARATKPQLDFSRLMGNMNRPNAITAERSRVEEQAKRNDSKAQLEAETAERDKVTHGLKKLTLGLTSLGIAVLTIPGAITRWGDSLVDARRHLGMFDGRIQSAISRLDIQKLQLDQRFAQATGKSSARVLAAQENLREAYEPLREDLQIAVNKLLVPILQATAFIVKYLPYLSPAALALHLLAERDKKKAAEEMRTAKFLGRLKDQNVQGGVRPALPPIQK